MMEKAQEALQNYNEVLRKLRVAEGALTRAKQKQSGIGEAEEAAAQLRQELTEAAANLAEQTAEALAEEEQVDCTHDNLLESSDGESIECKNCGRGSVDLVIDLESQLLQTKERAETAERGLRREWALRSHYEAVVRSVRALLVEHGYSPDNYGTLPSLRNALEYRPTAERDDPSVVSDLLSLAMDPHPTEGDVMLWSEEERKLAAEWAAAIHLRASDNDVAEPPMPYVIARWYRSGGCD